MIPMLQQGQLGRSVIGGGSSGGSDPHFSSVVLLLHADGTNGQTTTVDSSPVARAMTMTGSASLDTTQKAFGTTSHRPGASPTQLTCAGTTDFFFGTGDFTVEGWFYISVVGGPYLIANMAASGSQGWYMTVDPSNNGRIVWGDNGAVNATYGNGGISFLPAFEHLAVTRASGTLRTFRGGALQHTVASHTTNYVRGSADSTISIGSRTSTGNILNGWIDEVRITKGIARYTAAFTPPSAAFPNA